MDNLIYNNSIITFNDIDYPYEQVEKIDDMCVHVFMGGQIIALIGEETFINGIVMQNSDEIIGILNNT